MKQFGSDTNSGMIRKNEEFRMKNEEWRMRRWSTKKADRNIKNAGEEGRMRKTDLGIGMETQEQGKKIKT